MLVFVQTIIPNNQQGIYKLQALLKYCLSHYQLENQREFLIHYACYIYSHTNYSSLTAVQHWLSLFLQRKTVGETTVSNRISFLPLR